MRVIAVLQQVAKVTATFLSVDVGWSATNDLRADLAEHVLRAARGGDEGATRVLEQFAFWISVGLSNTVALLDPEMVIVGGPLAADWDALGGHVRGHLENLVLAGQYRPPLRIEPTALGERGGALGAALLARRVADAAS